MKTYKVKVQYTFECEWEFAANNIHEAKMLAMGNRCWIMLWSWAVRTDIPDEQYIDHEYPFKPIDKKYISIKKSNSI